MSEHDQNDPSGQSAESQDKPAEDAAQQETVAPPQAPAPIPPLPPPPPEGGDMSWLEADDPAPVNGPPQPVQPPQPPQLPQPPEHPPVPQPPQPPEPPPVPQPPQPPEPPPVPQPPEPLPVPQPPPMPQAPGVPPPLPPLTKPGEAAPKTDDRPQFGGPVFPAAASGPVGTMPMPGPISGYAGPEQVEAAEPDSDTKSAEVAEAKVTQPFSFTPSGVKKLGGRPDFGGRRARMLGAVVLILLLIAGLYFLWPSSSGESKAVALQFHTGQQLRYRVSFVTKGTVSAGTLSVPIGMQMNAVADLRVTSVAGDGTATVAVTLGNFQVSSQPQSWAHSVPTVVHTRMEIAPNGSIVSGGFGLANIATIGETSPGIGQFAPLLPPGPVQAGATWTQTSKLAVLGDQTVTVTAKNKLLGFTGNESGEVAVVTSSVTMPVSLSFPVADFASMASSSPKKQEQIAASDIVLESKGTSTVEITSQISMGTNTVVSTHNAGTTQLTLAATSASAGAQGSLHLTATDSMTIEQIAAQGKPAAPASAKPSSSKSGAPLFP